MIEPILAAMRMTTPAAEQRQLERFLTAYYAGVDPADLAERTPGALLADALSHRTLAAERVPGTTRFRVANPPLDTPGPHATHTVIEIVHDDMPFLVDSVTMAINQHALSVHLLVHPVLAVRRDAAGLLIECPATDAALPHESWMRLEIDRVSDPARLEALGKELEAVLGDVRAAVGDWRAMLARLRAVIGEVRQHRRVRTLEETLSSSRQRLVARVAEDVHRGQSQGRAFAVRVARSGWRRRWAGVGESF